MSTLESSLSMFQNQNLVIYLMKGVAFTLIISALSVLFALIFGSILALLRNYCKGKLSFLRIIATAYIEIFRNTPLLLWIFVSLVVVPAPPFLQHKMFGLSSVEVGLMFKGTFALIFYTSAVIAEIVRGGLNAVPQGQFEAAHSQGFSNVQVMTLIVLPQAYRHIIPTLLGQVVTTIKDSSFLANIAIIELMARTKQILASAGMYNGTGQIHVSDVFVLFGFAFIIYFIIDFILSQIVRRMQKKSA